MAAGRENPFKSDRIHSSAIDRVGSLKDDISRHRVHRKLEASAEKARQVRLRQDPSISHARVPDARIAGATRDRVPATGPNLNLVTTLLWTILGRGKRNCQKRCQNKHRKECPKEYPRDFPKKAACSANRSSHKWA